MHMNVPFDRKQNRLSGSTVFDYRVSFVTVRFVHTVTLPLSSRKTEKHYCKEPAIP